MINLWGPMGFFTEKVLMRRKKKFGGRTGGVLLDYLAATGNEIAIDNFLVNKLIGRCAKAVGYLPRVGRWIGLSSRCPRAIYSIGIVCRFVWVAGGGVTFFLMQLLPVLYRSSSKVSESVGAASLGFVLALSSRVGDVVHPGRFGAIPNTWITMPWAPLRRVPDGAVTVSVFSLLSRVELLQAFCLAVRALYILFWRRKTSKWVLQSYTAFRWFVVRAAVDKLSGQLVMAEHYDRWAVLVDGSVRASKKSVFPSGGNQERELVLIQHGVLGGLGSSATISDVLKLPRKLGVVSRLYVYGVESENIFKRDVLTEGCVRRGLSVHYFKPSIDLIDILTSSGLRLLFVGHPLCESLHKYVFESLNAQLDFKGYYKQHPMAPMSASMKDVGWEIIEDISTFPAVDLLIAYPSTLVVEYDGLGIPAAVHPMNLGCEDAENYMKSVYEMINSIKARQATQ